MKNKKVLRILVVEDDRAWNQALQGLFREQVPNSLVQGTRTGEEALQRLRSEQFDLLSLDINLSGTHPLGEDGRPDYSVPGYDGLDVLEKAAEWGACTGVIVISGLQHDEALRFIVREETKRLAVTLTPELYLERHFPGRGLVLFKSRELGPSESVEFLRSALDPVTLRRLTQATMADDLVPPYTIICDEHEIPPRIIVQSRASRQTAAVIHEPADRFFLFQLILSKRAGACVSDEESLQAYRNSDSPQIAIDSFRRRLRKLGVDPSFLFSRLRSGRIECRGWQLVASVKVRGAASVDKGGIDPDLLPEV